VVEPFVLEVRLARATQHWTVGKAVAFVEEVEHSFGPAAVSHPAVALDAKRPVWEQGMKTFASSSEWTFVSVPGAAS
jgi:hypothetical protein